MTEPVQQATLLQRLLRWLLQRLQRLLERQVSPPSAEGGPPPEWLEAVDRIRAEAAGGSAAPAANSFDARSTADVLPPRPATARPDAAGPPRAWLRAATRIRRGLPAHGPAVTRAPLRRRVRLALAARWPLGRRMNATGTAPAAVDLDADPDDSGLARNSGAQPAVEARGPQQNPAARRAPTAATGPRLAAGPEPQSEPAALEAMAQLPTEHAAGATAPLPAAAQPPTEHRARTAAQPPTEHRTRADTQLHAEHGSTAARRTDPRPPTPLPATASAAQPDPSGAPARPQQTPTADSASAAPVAAQPASTATDPGRTTVHQSSPSRAVPTTPPQASATSWLPAAARHAESQTELAPQPGRKVHDHAATAAPPTAVADDRRQATDPRTPGHRASPPIAAVLDPPERRAPPSAPSAAVLPAAAESKVHPLQAATDPSSSSPLPIPPAAADRPLLPAARPFGAERPDGHCEPTRPPILHVDPTLGEAGTVRMTQPGERAKPETATPLAHVHSQPLPEDQRWPRLTAEPTAGASGPAGAAGSGRWPELPGERAEPATSPRSTVFSEQRSDTWNV